MSDKEFSLRCDILSLRIAGKIDSCFDTEKAIAFLLDGGQKPQSMFVGKEYHE